MKHAHATILLAYCVYKHIAAFKLLTHPLCNNWNSAPIVHMHLKKLKCPCLGDSFSPKLIQQWLHVSFKFSGQLCLPVHVSHEVHGPLDGCQVGLQSFRGTCQQLSQLLESTRLP